MLVRVRATWLLTVACLTASVAAPARAGAATPVAVHGRVEDGAGRPVRDAVLRLYPLVGTRAAGELQLAGTFPPPHKAEAKSDGEGGFRLDAPAAGVWKLIASASGRAPRELLLRPLVEETWLPTVTLPPDAPLEVHVANPAGKPVAGAPVIAVRSAGDFRDPWTLPSTLLLTDAQGSATVHCGSAERVDLTAAAVGFVLAKVEGAGGSSSRIVLQKGLPRELLVVGPDGRAVAQATVMAAASGVPLAKSDAAGRATLAVAGSEPLAVLVEDGSGATASVTLVPPAPGERPRPLRVQLERTLTLSGRAIDARSREPIAGAVVFVGRRLEAATTTDAAGGYTLARVPGRNGSLQGAAAGHFDGFVDLGDPARLGGKAPTLALVPAASLIGSVVDGRGRPLAGVEVAAVAAPEGGRMRFVRRRGMAGLPLLARTDERGRFRIAPLPTEVPHEVSFRRQGYAPRFERVPPARPERPAELHVTLGPGVRGVGRVLAGGGEPVAGARVTLERQEKGSTTTRMMRILSEKEKPAAEAATDAAGRFVLADLAAGQYVLTVAAAGFAPTAAPGVEVPAAVPEVDLGTVRLAAGAAVEGRVVGPRGEPIEGAEVFVLDGMASMAPSLRWGLGGKAADATSAADGAFRIADRTHGDKVDLGVTRSGFTDGRLVGVVAPTEEPVTVTLQPASDLRGRVVDEGGDAVAGASVSLTVERAGGGFAFMSMAGSATTGDDGRFTVEDVEPGPVKATVRADGYLPLERAGLEVPAGKDLEGLELVVHPGATVEGMVTTPEGRPAVGAEVHVMAEGEAGARFSGRMSSAAQTDGDGRYRMEGVEPGARTLQASHEEYDRAVAALEVRAGENHLDLRLGGGQQVSGRAAGPGGQPVGGATVSLTAPGMPWFGGGEHSATTDAAGLFGIDGVPDGTYDAIAVHPDFAQGRAASSVTVAGAAVTGVAIELAPGGSIVGSLQGLTLGELARVGVTAFAESSGWREGTVSYDGKYRVGGLGSGDWTVVARVEGGRQARGQATLAAGDAEETLDLDFEGGLVVSGLVRHEGKAVDGALVRLRGSDVAGSADGRSDYAGRFRLENLEPGTYELEVNVLQSGLRHHERLTLDADRELVIDLRSTRVAGTVLDSADGDPIAGVRISVEPVGEAPPDFMPFRGQVTTDDTGRFAIGTGEDGVWRLTAQKAGYAQAEKTVEVSGQPVEGVEVRLQATQGITLRVARTAGAPPRDVIVAVLDAAGRAVMVGPYPTGENGAVRLATVPAGSWQLLVRSEDSGTVEVPAVSPGPPVAVLLAPQATLTVVVPELAGSTALVPLTLTAADGRAFRFPGWGSVETDLRLSHGKAVVTHLPAGTWTLRAVTPDGKSWEGTATTVAGGSTTVELH
jgi:protocatechuate 3,4-dioxygenase beta subunit